MHPANEQFVEKMGLLFEADGMPRISGRMLGLLLLTPGECSLDDIGERLQVSKASVSTNARLLEGFGIVEKVSRPGDRRDYYQIADDMQQRMMERKLERMRQVRDLIADARQTVVAEDPSVDRRLHALQDLHAHIVQNIEREMERLARRKAAPEEETAG